MRWLVEVSSIGKTDLQKFCVEAESWQRALQAARAQRGEEGPMSGFSVELIEEGYRAVDPIARVRFVVTRAPDDVPLTAPASSVAPTVAPDVAATAEPAAALAPVGSALPGLPPLKLLFAREEEPTEASPLTYREYSFAVPPGTPEPLAADVLLGQLKLVDARLANVKMGKLVNLAVFDVEFTGKPPAPPIATLAWKDWKGEPVIGYPRRGVTDKPIRPPTNPPASGSVPAPGVVIPPPSSIPTHLVGIAPSPNPPVPEIPPAPVTVQLLPRPPLPASVPPTGAAESVHVPSTHAPPSQHASTAPGQHASTAPGAQPPLRASSPDGRAEALVRTPSGRFVRGRTTGEELVTALFESMHDLHFLRDALDGGQFCLALATEVLPARAALIHFFDVEKREWIVACTRGKDTTRLLTMRTPENDELLREATRKRRAIVTLDAETATAPRYRSLGDPQSLIIAPIMQAGRALGALEIIGPLDGMPFTDDEGNAMTYIAEQYAEYLGSRGIVLDSTRIQKAAASR